MPANNTLITPTIIAKEALYQLDNNLVMASNCHRAYVNEFKKIGDSVQIRKPVKFTVKDGATLQKQDVIERWHTLQLTQRKQVSWPFTTQELTLTIEQYSERYIKPAMIQLANSVDVFMTGLYNKFWLSAGTPGTHPSGFDDFADNGALLDDGAVPNTDRCAVLNPKGKWGVLKGEKNLFNNDQKAQADMIRRGVIGTMAEFRTMMDQNVRRHTTGTQIGGAWLVNNAAVAEGDTTLPVDGVAGADADAFKAGDVFTIAGVNKINPVTYEDLGELQQFVVTADSAQVAGAATLNIAPALYTKAGSGALATVASLPADNAALTFVGNAGTAYAQNLMYHNNALALVTVPLILPDSATFKARVNYKGVSMRVIKAYDEDEDEEIIRCDILFGGDAIYPETGSRLWGG